MLKESQPKNATRNCNSYNEGTRKSGSPCKRWREKFEDSLNIMGIK
jgi:hypothetical protein